MSQLKDIDCWAGLKIHSNIFDHDKMFVPNIVTQKDYKGWSENTYRKMANERMLKQCDQDKTEILR